MFFTYRIYIQKKKTHQSEYIITVIPIEDVTLRKARLIA